MIKVIFSIFVTVTAFFLYIDAFNQVMEIKLILPQLQKSLKKVQAENERLQYEIEQFESPIHLIEMARQPEYSHLKNSYQNQTKQVFFSSEILK